MARRALFRNLLVLALASGFAVTGRATAPDAADSPMRQFLNQDDAQPSYRALRSLEAQYGSHAGWMRAETEFAPASGFRYRITAQGGSPTVRGRVLKALLDGEEDVIEHGESARSSLAPVNYKFQPNGIGADGLASILVSPRRKERVLIAGTMFVQPDGGDLVRLEGVLAKSPSMWIKDVHIVRTYQRIGGVVVPVALQTRAQVRFLGEATLRMTYAYSEINGQQVQ